VHRPGGPRCGLRCVAPPRAGRPLRGPRHGPGSESSPLGSATPLRPNGDSTRPTHPRMPPMGGSSGSIDEFSTGPCSTTPSPRLKNGWVGCRPRRLTHSARGCSHPGPTGAGPPASSSGAPSREHGPHCSFNNRWGTSARTDHPTERPPVACNRTLAGWSPRIGRGGLAISRRSGRVVGDRHSLGVAAQVDTHRPPSPNGVHPAEVQRRQPRAGPPGLCSNMSSNGSAQSSVFEISCRRSATRAADPHRSSADFASMCSTSSASASGIVSQRSRGSGGGVWRWW